eukprot:RCo027195
MCIQMCIAASSMWPRSLFLLLPLLFLLEPGNTLRGALEDAAHDLRFELCTRIYDGLLAELRPVGDHCFRLFEASHGRRRSFSMAAPRGGSGAVIAKEHCESPDSPKVSMVYVRKVLKSLCDPFSKS